MSARDTKESIAARIIADMGDDVLSKKAIKRKYRVGFNTASEVYFQLGIDSKTPKEASNRERNKTGEYNPYFATLYRPGNKNYLSVSWI